MQVIDAAYNLVESYPGGATSLGPRIGKAGNTLSHEVTRTGNAKLGLETAVAISVMSGDMRILEAFAAQCGRMTLPLPSVLKEGGDSVMARQGDVLREVSHLVREVSDAITDSEISGNERDSILREGGELMSTLTLLLAEVDKRHKEGIAAKAALGGAA